MKTIEKLHKEILWTTVRIKAEKAWGSGTVIYSGQGVKGEWHSYVLTCEHVVHDNIKVETKFDPRVGYDIKKEIRIPCEVEFFYYDKYSVCQGVSGSTKADIVAYDVDGDMALLELRRNLPIEYVAKLFPKNHYSEIHVFDKVYAVGAALGHEPVATEGMINFMNELIDEGVEYWMSNAPIIFGNSGGAVFRYSIERQQYEFIGMPARVAVSMMGFMPDPITHLAWFVPINRIYKLLDDNFYQFIYDKNFTYEKCEEEREKYRKEMEKLLISKFGGTPEKQEHKSHS
ncbi:MAG: S1 family peptidase [Caldisericum exile]|uniref:S1 family peptidase n=1 Tax=Caldisericum exile TaxID=693075 RepID=UPI003C780630